MNNIMHIHPPFVDIEYLQWKFEVDCQTPFFTDKNSISLHEFREAVSALTKKTYATYEHAYRALGLFVLACNRCNAEIKFSNNHSFTVQFWFSRFNNGDLEVYVTNFKFSLYVQY